MSVSVNGAKAVTLTSPLRVMGKMFGELSMRRLLWQVSRLVLASATNGAVGIAIVVCEGSYGVDPFKILAFEIYPGNGGMDVPDELPAQPTQNEDKEESDIPVLVVVVNHLVPFR